MNKQIITNRGYITYALTNENGEIYGLIQNHWINWSANEVERSKRLYWSEVYCEEGSFAKIIRKGRLLVTSTAEELQNYFEQSKINLN